MKQSSPALKKASDYLKTMLQKGVWKPGDRLPSIRELAQSAGISSVPMWKAVNLLASDGELEVLQGSGIRVKPYPEEPSRALRKGWLGLRDRIHRDVLSGLYPPGSLMPSLKEMRVHYGVSFQTLKKALDDLASSGCLTRSLRTYKVVAFSAQKTTASIVLLGWSNPQIELQARTPWGVEFLRHCENLCSRMRVKLQIMRYTEKNGSVVYIDHKGVESHKLNDDSSVLGYLLWGECPDDLYRQVLPQLDRYRKPTAVLQEGSLLNLSDYARRNRNLKVFSIATGSNAAQNVAMYLLENGHKKIAYISPFHKSDWSKARLHGLQEIYSRSDEETAVFPYTIDFLGYTHEFREPIKPPEEMIKKLFPELDTSELPSAYLRSLEKLNFSLMRQLEFESVRGFTMPLLRKAAANKECSAWVCASDYTASIALDFLEQTERKLAVIGFDDTFEAFRRGLTSYNFNIQGLVQSMLSHVVNPSSGLSKNAEAFEIEGILVKRRTSFRVRS
ncbi:MAG: GntR family transcriptional regulator [Chitinispirillaceae bacterium]